MTFLGSVGPWRERVYLIGGLAPRYIVGRLPDGVSAHVGTTDVDLVIELVLEDSDFESYRTLAANLKAAGFTALDSCRWVVEVDGAAVKLEFLCDTDRVAPGKIFKPKGQKVGTKLGAFNIPGVALVTQDYCEHELEGQRLDGTGVSTVALRVAGLLPFVVLKALAYQDRHQNKDAYDLVFCLLNYGTGPDDGAKAVAVSPVRDHPAVIEGLALLARLFAHVERDAPGAYATFLADPSDVEGAARLRREAVAVVGRFLAAIR